MSSRGKEGDVGGVEKGGGGRGDKGRAFLPLWTSKKTVAEVEMNRVAKSKRQARARQRAKAARKARKKARP